MTLVNKIVRILPKKKVNINDLERKKATPKVTRTETVVKTGDAIVQPGTVAQSEGQAEEDETVYEILEIEIMPEKIICPDCGGLTLEGLEFCDKCGGDLTSF